MRNSLLKSTQLKLFQLLKQIFTKILYKKFRELTIFYFFYIIACILVPFFPCYSIIIISQKLPINKNFKITKIFILLIISPAIYTFSIILFLLYCSYACFVQMFQNLIKSSSKKIKKMMKKTSSQSSQYKIFPMNSSLNNSSKIFMVANVERSILSLIPEEPIDQISSIELKK